MKLQNVETFEERPVYRQAEITCGRGNKGVLHPGLLGSRYLVGNQMSSSSGLNHCKSIIYFQPGRSVRCRFIWCFVFSNQMPSAASNCLSSRDSLLESLYRRQPKRLISSIRCTPATLGARPTMSHRQSNSRRRD